MKTHILMTVLTALLLSACASKEGRSISSTQDTPDSPVEYAQREGNAGRDFTR